VALYGDGMLFFHMPRTGGQWVRAAFGLTCGSIRELGKYHATPADFPDEASARYSFTVIRDPLTWTRSVWAEARENESFFTYAPLLINGGDMTLSYGGWIESLLNCDPDWIQRVYDAYTYGNKVVGCMEVLNESVSFVLRKNKKRGKIPLVSRIHRMHCSKNLPELSPGIAQAIHLMTGKIEKDWDYGSAYNQGIINCNAN